MPLCPREGHGSHGGAGRRWHCPPPPFPKSPPGVRLLAGSQPHPPHHRHTLDSHLPPPTSNPCSLARLTPPSAPRDTIGTAHSEKLFIKKDAMQRRRRCLPPPCRGRPHALWLLQRIGRGAANAALLWATPPDTPAPLVTRLMQHRRGIPAEPPTALLLPAPHDTATETVPDPHRTVVGIAFNTTSQSAPRHRGAVGLALDTTPPQASRPPPDRRGLHSQRRTIAPPPTLQSCKHHARRHTSAGVIPPPTTTTTTPPRAPRQARHRRPHTRHNTAAGTRLMPH